MNDTAISFTMVKTW